MGGIHFGGGPDDGLPPLAGRGRIGNGAVKKVATGNGDRGIVLLQYDAAKAEIAGLTLRNAASEDYKVIAEGFLGIGKRILAVMVPNEYVEAIRGGATVSVFRSGTREFEEMLETMRRSDPQFLKHFLG
jgi:hypothetical protein